MPHGSVAIKTVMNVAYKLSSRSKIKECVRTVSENWSDLSANIEIPLRNSLNLSNDHDKDHFTLIKNVFAVIPV